MQENFSVYQVQIRYLLLVTWATKDRKPILQPRVKGTDSDPVPHIKANTPSDFSSNGVFASYEDDSKTE